MRPLGLFSGRIERPVQRATIQRCRATRVWFPLYSGSVKVEKRRVLRILLGTAVMGSAFLVAHGSAVAQGPTAEDAAQELAARYAPVVVLKAQDGECDGDGERFAPVGARSWVPWREWSWS